MKDVGYGYRSRMLSERNATRRQTRAGQMTHHTPAPNAHISKKPSLQHEDV